MTYWNEDVRPEELDDYLERARAESAATATPDGFTNGVMRAVRRREPAHASPGVLPNVIASGALVGCGAWLWVSGGATLGLAAVVVVLIGFALMWLDDPFGTEVTIRLLPW